MTTVLRHCSQYFFNSTTGMIYMCIEIIHDKTYTIKFTIHAPSNSNWNCEKYIRDIPYIPTPMLEMIKLLQLYENDFKGEKIYESLSTIFNSTLRQTMQKEYETYKIDAITIQKDKIEKENETLQLQLHESQKENETLQKENKQLQHKLTYTHYELLHSTSKLEKIEKELATAQYNIQQLSQNLEDTTTELKIWESRCMQYEDLYEQEKKDSSLETILETALDELYL